MTELADNVNKFLDIATEWKVRFHRDDWHISTWCQLTEGKMQSPIEHLFFIAAKALIEAYREEFNPGPTGINEWPRGMYVSPQVQIGTYKVDFLLWQVGIGPDDEYTPVVVELDGHAFHDKDKKQRAYEKARDRYLVKEKYRVLHFTGSEVVADPFKVAREALGLIGLFSGYLTEYNPEDPLEMGV